MQDESLKALELIHRIVLPMVEERSRELGDAWSQAATAIRTLLAQLEEREKLLREVREALALGAKVPLADPYILIELRGLCNRAGYGNVMSSASALWRQKLGELAGGEFVSGPCRKTAEAVISRIDAVLSTRENPHG